MPEQSPLNALLKIAEIFDRGDNLIMGQMKIIDVVTDAQQIDKSGRAGDPEDVIEALNVLASVNGAVRPEKGWDLEAQSAYGILFYRAVIEAVEAGRRIHVERRGQSWVAIDHFIDHVVAQAKDSLTTAP